VIFDALDAAWSDVTDVWYTEPDANVGEVVERIIKDQAARGVQVEHIHTLVEMDRIRLAFRRRPLSTISADPWLDEWPCA